MMRSSVFFQFSCLLVLLLIVLPNARCFNTHVKLVDQDVKITIPDVPGLKTTVTQGGLDYFKDVGMKLLQEVVCKIVEYRVFDTWFQLALLKIPDQHGDAGNKCVSFFIRVVCWARCVVIASFVFRYCLLLTHLLRRYSCWKSFLGSYQHSSAIYSIS